MEKKTAVIGAIATVVGTLIAAYALVKVSVANVTNMERDIKDLRQESDEQEGRLGTLEDALAMLPSGTIIAWDQVKRTVDGAPTGEKRPLPEGWSVCDGTNRTPDLTRRFLRGALTSGTTGGTEEGHTAAVDTSKGGSLNAHKHQTIDVNFSDTGVSLYGAPFGLGRAAEKGAAIHLWTKYGNLPSDRAWNHKLTDTAYISSVTTDLDKHVHKIETTPPFYEVIFIMKVN